MAWGSGGEVFLGEDLMHSRDYSDETARVVDEEVERILRDQEARALRLLREHQRGLAAVAQALIARETIDGNEVGRLVDQAYGRPVHEHMNVPSFATALTNGHGDPEAMPGEAPAGGIGGPTIVQAVNAAGMPLLGQLPPASDSSEAL
jgi:Peptidase family M41